MRPPTYDLRKEFTIATVDYAWDDGLLRIEEPGASGMEVTARLLLDRPSIAMLQDKLEELDRLLKRGEDGPDDEALYRQPEDIAARVERERQELRDAGRGPC